MVELTPEDVNEVVVPPLPLVKVQRKISAALRKSEGDAASIAAKAADTLAEGETAFRTATMPAGNGD